MAQARRHPGLKSKFLEHAFSLARSLDVQTVVILVEALKEPGLIKRWRQEERVIWLTSSPDGRPEAYKAGDEVFRIPDSRLTRLNQMKIGLFQATLDGTIGLAEDVLCLAGLPGAGLLDTMMLTRPKREFSWLSEDGLERTGALVSPTEFARLLELCLRFAEEGREGKPLGATFVLGDLDQLEPYTRQLILNPCAGHPRRTRSIHNPEFAESLREFAALDGAMIVDRKGVVESVGTYLDAPTRKGRLRAGLGARHAAAASITASTDAIALVLSESSRTVTVFDDGKAVLELERPL